MIIRKTNKEINLMREANRIAAIVLEEIKGKIKPGINTYELDQWAEERIRGLNAQPGFKGYRSQNRVYPATLCTSINEEVVHGIPSRDRVLKEGDILSVDVGTIYRGYYGDTAYTYQVGTASPEVQALVNTCRQALMEGIQAAVSGNRINDISRAIEKHVRDRGYEIVRELTGHGVGKALHEDPQILNFDDGQKKARLKPNMTLAIEPMITNGGWEVETLKDSWTVVTRDRSISAHFEHTILISDNGPEILSRI